MDQAWEPVRPVLAVIIAAVVAYLTALVIGWVVGRAASHSHDPLWRSLQRRCKAPFRATLVTCAVLIALPDAELSGKASETARHVDTLALIAAVSWLIIALSGVVEDVAVARINIDVEDNRQARRVRTQIAVLRRVVVAVVVFIGITAALMTFPRARTLGASFLASAGVLSVVVGLAAQATLANLLAGIQIALTDPLRIDDVVVVQGEWGRVEEITLTYVVIRTWDNRRLIYPVSWFTTNAFQNWTRHESRVLGSVVLHVDYRVPVDELRDEMRRLLEDSPLWDGQDWVLQVVDATPTTVVLRGLMSSFDAPSNWDLRCEVREKLLAFLEEHYPESLPTVRAEVASADGRSPQSGSAPEQQPAPAQARAGGRTELRS